MLVGDGRMGVLSSVADEPRRSGRSAIGVQILGVAEFLADRPPKGAEWCASGTPAMGVDWHLAGSAAGHAGDLMKTDHRLDASKNARTRSSVRWSPTVPSLGIASAIIANQFAFEAFVRAISA